MTPKEWGYVAYRLHVFLVVGIFVAFVVAPLLRPVIAIAFFPFFVGHVLYGRCPLTLVERRLHGENITILDPVLQLFGLPVTRENRHNLNAVLSTIFMLTFAVVLTRK